MRHKISIINNVNEEQIYLYLFNKDIKGMKGQAEVKFTQ